MKSLFTLALATFLATMAFAQETEKPAPDQSGLHFGLKAAPSLAWLRTDTKGVESDGSKFGFSYGLITEFRFAPNYAFATGLDVTYRGGKFKSEMTLLDTVTRSSRSISLQYVEIPLTLKLKTNEIGYLTYFLQMGVAPGINIRAKEDYEFTTQSGTYTLNGTEDNRDIKADINNFNLSMIIGGGVEYTLSGSTTLLIGVQFNNGFLDVIDGDEIKANSNYLALTIGILF